MFKQTDPCLKCGDTRRYLSNRRCPTCSAAYREKWRKENPEQAKELGLRNDRKRSRTPKRRASTRKSSLKNLYDVTPQQVDQKIADQLGACACCGINNATDQDHNALTGQLRGVLCPQCNKAIGLLCHSQRRIRAAADYLAQYQGT